MMNPRAPVFNGLSKILKANVPIIPIVNYTTALAYRMAKKLEKIIKAGLVYDENFSLMNTHDFISRTKNLILLSNHKLVSLDIVNLYTKVPVEKTIL